MEAYEILRNSLSSENKNSQYKKFLIKHLKPLVYSALLLFDFYNLIKDDIPELFPNITENITTHQHIVESNIYLSTLSENEIILKIYLFYDMIEKKEWPHHLVLQALAEYSKFKLLIWVINNPQSYSEEKEVLIIPFKINEQINYGTFIPSSNIIERNIDLLYLNSTHFDLLEEEFITTTTDYNFEVKNDKIEHHLPVIELSNEFPPFSSTTEVKISVVRRQTINNKDITISSLNYVKEFNNYIDDNDDEIIDDNFESSMISQHNNNNSISDIKEGKISVEDYFKIELHSYFSLEEDTANIKETLENMKLKGKNKFRTSSYVSLYFSILSFAMKKCEITINDILIHLVEVFESQILNLKNEYESSPKKNFNAHSNGKRTIESNFGLVEKVFVLCYNETNLQIIHPFDYDSTEENTTLQNNNLQKNNLFISKIKKDSTVSKSIGILKRFNDLISERYIDYLIILFGNICFKNNLFNVPPPPTILRKKEKNSTKHYNDHGGSSSFKRKKKNKKIYVRKTKPIGNIPYSSPPKAPPVKTVSAEVLIACLYYCLFLLLLFLYLGDDD